MDNKKSFERGWEFSAKITGDISSAYSGQDYVNAVIDTISNLEKNINEHPYKNLPIDKLQGYMLEEWAAGTFNVDAVASGAKSRATVLHSNDKNSIDIEIKNGKNIIKEISAKSYGTSEETAKRQAVFDRELGQASYKNQDRLVPFDKLKGSKETAHKEMLRNELTRPDVAEAYKETEQKLTDIITNDKGVQSKSTTRKELDEIAKESKKQVFEAEKHGVTIENSIKPEYIAKEAVKSGLTAATVTVVLQTAPEIFKAIDYLVKNGEIDIEQLKKAGIKALSSSAEGFIRGSVASVLQILCIKGAFGVALKTVDPTILGTIVAFTVETIKNSILVASGKMTPKEMGNALVDYTVISAGYIVGMNIGTSIAATKVFSGISGAIAQAIGFELPGLGYIIGSLIGCTVAAVYNIGKKKLISFCVDTGFTCFGLVEQDYQLPEEILLDMGVELNKIDFAEIEMNEIDMTEIDYVDVEETEFETIELRMVKRGIIGVNKVGYIL